MHERWDFTTGDYTSEAGVTEAFCLLSGFVAEKAFGWRKASDCFCQANVGELKLGRYQYEQGVYDFIVSAVNAKLEEEVTK